MTTKKPSPTKTRTGNALAQFVILSALTVVAYQFIATRLSYAPPASAAPMVDEPTSPLAGGRSGGSPIPWSDAALEKYRAKKRATNREVISTTEFSCFMACIGLFGLMQHKKKQRSEEAAIEAQRRAVEKRVLRSRGAVLLPRSLPSDDDDDNTLAAASPDALALLPCDVLLDLLAFLTAEELVECAQVNHAWHEATGDAAERLWKGVFERDHGEPAERFAGVVPRICWRQYYFLHRLSRAVELARWLDAASQRKCVVIQGHVYDVTSFLDAHPGGYHVIGDVLGTDATELWDQFQHSAEAKALMKDFLVPDAVLDAWSSRDAAAGKTPPPPQKNLVVVARRWRQLTWCFSHAHLFGNLSGAFVDVGFKVIVWRTTHSKPVRALSGSH